MLLKHVINGRQFPEFILVKDNALISGHCILSLLIQDRVDKGIHTYFLAFEPNDYSVLKKKHGGSQFFHFVDTSVDSNHCLKDIVWIKDKLREEGTIEVVVDSITSSVVCWSYRELFSTIRSLQELNEGEFKLQLVALLHSDVLPEESPISKQLRIQAKCVIAVEKQKKKCLATVESSSSCKLSKEVYSLGSSHEDTLTYELYKEEANDPMKAGETEDDGPKVRTTFKLSLDDSEKKSRSQVILPYIKTPGKEQGRIFYEPDANDDWDDEDPDDDLEI